MLPMGIEYGCAALVLTDLISETICTLVVTAAYFADVRAGMKKGSAGVGRPEERTGAVSPIKDGEINRAIWNIAAPITASHYLTSLLRTVESTLVPDCLTVYEGSRVRALELFGMIKGMALPLSM